MTEQPTISLIFPAYNEEKRIEQTVSEAVQYFVDNGFTYEIIVAADGDDSTRDIVSKMGESNPNIHVIGNNERRGKGYGLRQAMPLCKGKYIGFSDADNKTPITELDKVMPLLQQGADMVIGQRPYGGDLIEKKQKWYRQLGSRGFRIFMHFAVGLDDIVDTQCGFKFFKAPIAKDLFARQKIDGYMYDVEILYLAEQLGYGIQQVEVRWRDDGDSRLDLIAGNIRNVKDVLKVRRLHAGKLTKSQPTHEQI